MPTALDDVEPVGEGGQHLLRLAAHHPSRGQRTCQHRGYRAAAPGFTLGQFQPPLQHGHRLAGVAVHQVAEADQQVGKCQRQPHSCLAVGDRRAGQQPTPDLFVLLLVQGQRRVGIRQRHDVHRHCAGGCVVPVVQSVGHVTRPVAEDCGGRRNQGDVETVVGTELRMSFDLLDQPGNRRRILAECRDPGCSDLQTHVSCHDGCRQSLDPVVRRRKTAFARDIEQALRGMTHCHGLVAGRERVTRRLLVLPVIGVPRRRALVAAAALVRRQPVELAEQEVTCHCMQSQPVAPLAFGNDRRLVGKPPQVAARLPATGHRLAQFAIHRLENGNPHQESGLLRREAGYQGLEEESLQVATAGIQLTNHRVQVGGRLDRRSRELKADRPALHEVVQVHRVIEPDPVSEAQAQDFQRLLDGHAEVADAECRHSTAGHQVGQVQLQRPA